MNGFLPKLPRTAGPLALALTLLVAPGADAIFGAYAGGGPRIRGEEVDTIGNLKAAVGFIPLMDFTLDAYGYLGLGDEGQSFEFAGGTVGLLFSAPIPGPIGLQMGASAGYTQLTETLHGKDEKQAFFNWEAAGLWTIVPFFDLRLAYKRAIAGPTSDNARAMDWEILLQLGTGI